MASWGLQEISMPTYELDQFIRFVLRPHKNCETKLDLIVERLCTFLQEAKELRLERHVATGGSYGRKTVLRGNSDGTLVIFASDFTQFQDLKKNQNEILNKIQKQLEICLLDKLLAANMMIQRRYNRLTIQLSTEHQDITFEVLPAFNPLGASDKPSPGIYRDLIRSLNETRASPGEFSACFTELQRKFFDNRPQKLKDLILLIKHWWHQKCQKKLNNSSLQPIYALELLTIYTWEQGSGAENFSIEEGLRSVLRLMEQQEKLCVYWTVNYNFEDETVRNMLLRQLHSPRPVILDPTDPTNNLSQDKTCWQLLKTEAQCWLSSLTPHESHGSSWNVLPGALSETPGHLLDRYIKDFLQPNKDFIEQLHKAVMIICTFLKENCFRHSTTKVLKAVKGGSAAKGTALKNGSDADLVVFLSSLRSYTAQKHQRRDIIDEIRKQLEICKEEKQLEVKFEISKWQFPRVLSFSLKSKELKESVDFDVLPAFNPLGQVKSGWRPDPSIYAELIRLCESSKVPGGEFSTCFTELQRDFIAQRPIKLKDLVRLVKHWYKLCERKLKRMGSLPPKYALELLTIYAWEHGSGEDNFDTAEGFRTVLELVMKYRELCIFWTVNYNFQNETVRNFLLAQIQKTRPVILDPAEPTGDVGGGNRWCWRLLAQEAKEWLSFLCFKDGTGNTIRPWLIPTVQTPGSCGAQMQPVVHEMVSFRSRSLV
ncbi:2'-5'-oligoadenylate synthase 2 [Talpa occidentalis]|uniref:2'-5'-oligoadenylate synthase 2 n=1 Tax=Talpa occidentalis TaxID=50954 RepID=UPI00188DCFC8|nr:2'-5'-oligoadenylate synthase 2 [Talpa occidentalis]